MARAVLLNDTSTRFHHGCARVVRLLVEGLAREGVEVAARSPARADWARDRAFLEALGSADLVVVNGEGTLHDGAPLGARLLSVLDHPLAAAKPVALVNALWERNPPCWDRWLPRLALAAARDEGSAEALRRGGALEARALPDLSLSAPWEGAAGSRRGLVVGDSVRAAPRRALARAAQRLGAAYLPTKTARGRLWRWGPARAALWRAYTGAWSGPLPPLELAPDEGAYLARLARAEGHATGRFHGVCLSLLAGTPVWAVASATSKVERLLAEAGLPSRLLSAEALERLSPEEARRPLADSEARAVAAYLARARGEARRLFADLRALCP